MVLKALIIILLINLASCKSFLQQNNDTLVLNEAVQRSYKNPIQWALAEYKTMSMFAIIWTILSALMNMYFLLTYFGILHFKEKKREIIRLQPTDDFL